MKKILPFFIITIFCGCGGNTSNPNSTMDSVQTRSLIQDTTIHPRPNGYAPPQADTTNLVDSANSSKDSGKEH